jgi:hypothetical protein
MQREFVDLLKGCRPIKDENGNIIVQSILNMKLVCLTTDDEYSLDSRFSNPIEALKVSNSTYGQMTFQNKTSKEVIVPMQMAVITKQVAQNHGMVKGGYLTKNQQKTYHDAGCVQGMQGGTFREVGGDEFRLIPLAMREMLLNAVGQTVGHSNIYPAIQKLGIETQSDAGHYLDKYFAKYDKKLSEFIAHFERPKKIIGTIVLIDDEIVAIDKFPSFSYAEYVWDLLIRDCYGSMAIINELKQKKARTAFTDEYNRMKGTSSDVLDKIAKALEKVRKNQTKDVTSKIEELLDQTFDATLDNEGSQAEVKSYVLKNTGYLGQVISEGKYHHMVSLVKKEAYNPNALRDRLAVNRMANKQEKFSI